MDVEIYNAHDNIKINISEQQHSFVFVRRHLSPSVSIFFDIQQGDDDGVGDVNLMVNKYSFTSSQMLPVLKHCRKYHRWLNKKWLAALCIKGG
jgi:hypothetical protein